MLPVAKRWLQGARPGYCGVTGIGSGDSSCSAGPCNEMFGCKGTFNLPARKVSTWPQAVRFCLHLCNHCERCHAISVSLHLKDCSWFERCDTTQLQTNIPGFKSGVVNDSSKKHVRRRRRSSMGSGRDEVALRQAQLHDYAAINGYNLSTVLHLLEHRRIRHLRPQGIHLHASGRRWNTTEFQEHMREIYISHDQQSTRTRQWLKEKWNRVLIGTVDVWSMLHLLHFTIDHTDSVLLYTSQFIHTLQVYQTVLADPMPHKDHIYRRDMQIAALVHDFGKLLTLFGDPSFAFRKRARKDL